MRRALPSLFRTLLQVGVLILFWWVGGRVAALLGLPVPGGVIGLAMLLALFAAGVLRPSWLKAGAGLLLAEMLLFFIPAAMSLLDYGPLLRSEGWRILLVIVFSTLMVMAATALAVEWMGRRQAAAADAEPPRSAS